LVIVALATVPFLNKAFHIDDFSYLQISRQILRAPLQPYDFYWRTYDDAPEYVFARHPSPPLLNYVIAAGILFFGENEVPLRCIMSVFTTGAAVSVYWLAVRFRCNPLAAATLMVLNPLLVPSQNLMLDVPALSFGLGGIACHVWGTDRGSWRLVALGGLLAGLAVVTKYPALVLVAPMVFYSWTQRSRLVVVAVLVTMLPLVLWSVQNLVMERRVHFLESLAATPMDLQE
jgi:4-amino-4-deoxy-L-arabinose transferase-like glycosyltransferase